MTFIFSPEFDPRREETTMPFAAGDTVDYRGMAHPAEVISGPHKSPGQDRYLIRKADGNVSLVPVKELTRHLSREEKAAIAIYRGVTGRNFVLADASTRRSFLLIAKATLVAVGA
jgi:hypothetical protein